MHRAELRLLVFDPLPLLAAAFASLLGHTTGSPVSHCSTLAEARQLAPHIDAALVHLSDPLTPRAVAYLSAIPRLVVFDSKLNPARARKLLLAGADVLLDRTASLNDLNAALLSADPPPTTPGLAGDLANLEEQLNTIRPLAPREISVLELVSTGYSTAAIAEKMRISQSTVRNHLGRVFRKLSVTNRTDALSEARRLGIINDPHHQD